MSVRDKRALRWTPEEDDVIIAMRPEGISFQAIGARIGRSEKSCSNRHGILRRRGLTADAAARAEEAGAAEEAELPEPWTEEESCRLIQMRNDGYGWEDIAVALARPLMGIRSRYARLQRVQVLEREAAELEQLRQAEEERARRGAAPVALSLVPGSGRPPRPRESIHERLDRLPGGKMWTPETDLWLATSMSRLRDVRAVARAGGLDPEDVRARWYSICPDRAQIGAIDALIAVLRQRLQVAA